MKFSIITPSFKQPDWLKLCVKSVKDQVGDGIEVEHIIQDAGTPDIETLIGSEETPGYSRKLIVEKDNGIHDAVNRGWRKATGDILFYINCDEQLLIGALGGVAEWFKKNPKTDMLFTDVVVTDVDGSYVCHRQSLPPQRLHCSLARGDGLSFFTLGCFFRREALLKHQLFFDGTFFTNADAKWGFQIAAAKGLRIKCIRYLTSIYSQTGYNMGRFTRKEDVMKCLRLTSPHLRFLFPVLKYHLKLRRLLAGFFDNYPFSYSIYTPDSPDQRRFFYAMHPTQKWKWVTQNDDETIKKLAEEKTKGEK